MNLNCIFRYLKLKLRMLLSFYCLKLALEAWSNFDTCFKLRIFIVSLSSEIVMFKPLAFASSWRLQSCELQKWKCVCNERIFNDLCCSSVTLQNMQNMQFSLQNMTLCYSSLFDQAARIDCYQGDLKWMVTLTDKVFILTLINVLQCCQFFREDHLFSCRIIKMTIFSTLLIMSIWCYDHDPINIYSSTPGWDHRLYKTIFFLVTSN